MKVLGIETSCDETAVAVVEDGVDILVNLIASQIEVHQQFGGVYPEVASRHHIEQLLPLVEQAITKHKPDLIAVTNGPGLMGALLMGVICAETLAYGWKMPLVGVNHVEAHLYSAMMSHQPCFPALGIVVSGGHTFLAKMVGICDYEILGTTVDDAIGEAFDKVAALLELPYPGGPHIEKLALHGNPNAYPFQAGQIKSRPIDFSFSGLKTNVLYTVKGAGCNKRSPTIIADEEKKHIAASFQEAALKDVVDKALKAAASFDCQAIYCGGGVAQSQRLRELFKKSPYPVLYPGKGLCVDNGAMIAGLGFHLYQGKNHLDKVHAYPNLRLDPASYSLQKK